MQSLVDLNQYALDNVIEVTDMRHSRVIFDRPWRDQWSTWKAGLNKFKIEAEALEIVNYDLADVRCKIVLMGTNAPAVTLWTANPTVGSGIMKIEIPGGVEYRRQNLSGFSLASDLNRLLEFQVELPADYATYGNYFFRVEVSWHSTQSGERYAIESDVYDPRFYPVADFFTTANMTPGYVRRRASPVEMTAHTSMLVIPQWAKYTSVEATAQFECSAYASGDIAPFVSVFALQAAGVSGQEEFPKITAAVVPKFTSTGASGQAEFPKITAAVVPEFTPVLNRARTASPSILSTAVVVAEVERMYNTAVAPSGFAYTEDAQAGIQQAMQDAEFAITAWRPEEEFELTIDSLTNSDINTYPTHQRQPNSTGLGVEASYQGCAANPFDNRIVAVGAGGVIKFSDDLGATFTAATVNGTAPGTLLEVRYNTHLKHWITIDSAGRVYLSTDGATWDYTTTAPTGSAVDIAYKPGYGYVITRGSGRNFAYSADGTAWSTIPGTSNGNSIAYSETRDTWVAAVTDGVMYSTDAVNWTLITLAAGVSMNGVVWTGSEFVVVGSSSVVYRSPDGIEWTTTDAPPGTKWRRVAHHAGGNILMAVAGALFTGNRVMISLDRGLTWTQLSETLAVANVCSTRDGFFVASTTGGSRGFRWHFNVPRLMPSAIRVSGTPAEIETALAGFSFVGAVDQASALTVRVKLTHALTNNAVYFDEFVPVAGTALVNATFPNLQSANYTEDSIVNVGQLLLNNGFAITDTAVDNAYEIQLGCTPIGYGAASDFNSLVTKSIAGTGTATGAQRVFEPTPESSAGSEDLLAFLNEPDFTTLKTSADRGQTWVTRTMPVDTQASPAQRGIFYSTEFNQWYLSDYNFDTNAFQIYQTSDFDTWTAVGSIPGNINTSNPSRGLRFISTAAGDLFFVLVSDLYNNATRIAGMNAFATVNGQIWGSCFHPIVGMFYLTYDRQSVIGHSGHPTAPAQTKEHIVFGDGNYFYAYPIALVPNTVSGTRTQYAVRRSLTSSNGDTVTRNGVVYYISLAHIYAVMAGPHGINLVASYSLVNQDNSNAGTHWGVLHSPSIHLAAITEATGIDYTLFLPPSWTRVPAVMSSDTGVGYISVRRATATLPNTFLSTFATVDGKTWVDTFTYYPLSQGTVFLTAAGNSAALIGPSETQNFKFRPIVGESGEFSTAVITGTDIANLHAQLSAVTWQGSIDSYENQLLSIQAKSTRSGHDYGTGVMRLMGQAGSNHTGPTSTSYTQSLPFTTNGFGLNITDSRAGNEYFYQIEPLAASWVNAASELQFGLQFTLDTSMAYYHGAYHAGRDLYVALRQHDAVSTTARISYTLDRGQTWLNSTWTAASIHDAYISSVIITDTSVIAVTSAGRVYETTDFVTWTLRSQITNGSTSLGYYQGTAAVMDGVFYVGTSQGLVSSTDLVNWTLTTFNGIPIWSISVDGSRLAACGHKGPGDGSGNGVLAVYSNGQWTVNYPSTQYIYTVCVDGDRVYASFGQSNNTPPPTPVMVFKNNTWSVPSGFDAAQLVPNRRVNRIVKHPVTNVILMSQAAYSDSVTGIAYSSLADRSAWSVATKAVKTNMGFAPLGNDFAYFVLNGSTPAGGLMQSLPVATTTLNGQTGTYYITGSKSIVSNPVSINFTSASHTFRVSIGSTVSGRTYYSGVITINKA